MYAVWTGSNWSIQTVDENGTSYGSVILDSSNNPHIAYTDGQVLKYARWTGNNWNIQTVDIYDGISYSSLALDSKNIPYILYTAESSKLAVYNNSSWSIQTISNISNLSDIHRFGNIVIDSEDNPHFIYMAFTEMLILLTGNLYMPVGMGLLGLHKQWVQTFPLLMQLFWC